MEKQEGAVVLQWRRTPYPDVVEGVSLVVGIIDEAVAPVVPLWQGDSQPGVHILEKLSAILDCLQSRAVSVVSLSRAARMEQSAV